MRSRGIVLISAYYAIAVMITVVGLFSVLLHAQGVIGAVVHWMVRLVVSFYVPFVPYRAGSIIAWALLCLLTSYGIWNMKPWGRILCIGLCIDSILATIPYFVMTPAFPNSFPDHGISVTIYHVLRVVIATIILVYLRQARVKGLFLRAEPKSSV